MMLSKFEAYLETTIIGDGVVDEAMRYSLLSGGKRVRPLLLLSMVEDLNGDVTKAFPMACALEMIHTYSLVHDDLPSMDNDDYRRHRPTNHKVYGEGTAILAGDGLLTEAFSMLCKSDLESDIVMSCVEVLSRNAGAKGMILGQELDIKDGFSTLEALSGCYQLKTGCLFAAAFEMAVISASRSDLQTQARDLGYKLGIVFQYQDDILEETKNFEEIGKSSDSDRDRAKNTVVGFLGLEEAQKRTAQYFEDVLGLVKVIAGDNSKCEALIHKMVSRAF